MLKYVGAYSSGTEYNVGDIVVYTDNVPYHLQQAAPAGTGCMETRCWGRVQTPLAECVMMFHSFLTGLKQSTDLADSVIFDNKTLLLASSTASSDKVWAVTVDDTSGLEVDEVEAEA